MPQDNNYVSLSELYNQNKQESQNLKQSNTDYKTLSELGLKTEAPKDFPLLAGLGENNVQLSKTPTTGTYDFLPYEGVDNEELRANNQSNLGLVAKGIWNTANSAVFQTGEGAGYLLDIPGWASSWDSSNQDYSNWFSDLMKKGEESLKAPIYRTHWGEGFNPLAMSWWADNAPSIGSSLSLMLPALGASKLLQIGKLAKLAGAGELGIDMAEGLSSSIFSRHMENTMEAQQTFEGAYKDLIGKGYNEEEAKQLAGKAASSDYASNWVLLASDFLQYSTLFRGFKASRAAKTESILQNIVQEGGEEGYQYIIQNETQKNADKHDQGSFSNRIKDYVTDGDFWTNTFFGGLGGAAFSAVGNKISKNKEKINDQNRAALVGDAKTFHDIEDESFLKLAIDHTLAGTAHKLESDISNAKNTPDDQIKDFESDPNNFRTKVDKRLKDLTFVEDTWNSMSNDPNKTIDQKRVELAAKVSQRLDENRLSDLNTEINTEMIKAHNSLNLDYDARTLKESLLSVKAIQKIPGYNKIENLTNQLKQFKDNIPSLYTKVKTSNPSLTNNSKVDDYLQHSSDTELVNKLKDKFELSNRLNQTKEFVKKTETKAGQEEIKNEAAKAFISDLKKTLTNNKITLENLKTSLENPTIKANKEATQIINEKIKQVENSQQEEERKKNIEVNKPSEVIPEPTQTKPGSFKEALLNRFKNPDALDNDVKGINEKLAQTEGNPQITVTTPEETSEALDFLNEVKIPAINKAIKEHYEDVKDSQDILSFIEDLSNSITKPIIVTQVDLKRDPIQEVLQEQNNVPNPFKIAYNDQDKPSEWWKSKPNELTEGTKLSFKTTEVTEEGRVRYEDKIKTEGNKEWLDNNPWSITPIGIYDNQDRLVGYVQALYNEEQAEANFELVRLRKDIFEGKQLSSIVSEKKSGIFNTVLNKNFGEKVEKIHETLGVSDYRYYLGYGIGNTVTVPNNDVYDKSIGTNKATNGAIYIGVQGGDGQIKPARVLLRNLNDKEIDKVIQYLKEVTLENYKFVEDKVNHITYAGARSGENNEKLYFDLLPEGIKFYDNDLETVLEQSYGAIDETYLKQFLATKRRNVDIALLNTFNRYEDPISGNVYENGYNEYLSENYIVTSDLVAGAPFRQAAIYYAKPIESTKEEKTIENIIKDKPKRKTRGDSRLGTRFSKVEDIDKGYKTWNDSEVESWFKKNLPQVDYQILDNLKEVWSKGGDMAWGLFHNSMIYIRNNSPEATPYHEAFHAVFNMFLNEKEKNSILDEAATKYNIIRKKGNLEFNDNLRTWNRGEIEGTFEKDTKSIVDDFTRNIPDGIMAEGAESFNTFKNRVLPALDKIIEDSLNGTVIVTHSQVFKLYENRIEGTNDINIEKYINDTVDDGEVKEIKNSKGHNIYIVRHGETIENDLGIDRTKDVSLNDSGLEQAYNNAEWLKDKGISKIISSNLERAKETANILNMITLTNDLDLEEELAKDFGKVSVTGNTKSFPDKIANFFKMLYQTLKHLISSNISIDELFYRINEGIYKRDTPILYKKNQSIETRFSLHPDFSIPSQREAIESINYRFFEEVNNILSDIKQTKGEKLGITELLTDNKYPIDDIYNKIRDQIIEDWGTEDKGINLILDNFEDRYMNGFKIEGLKSKHQKYLSLYGYNLKSRKVENDSEVEDFENIFETSEEDTKETWMYHYFEISGLSKLSANMKRLIGLTRDVTTKSMKDEEGNFIGYKPKYNMFGEFKLVNLNETYAYLVRNLAGINTFDDMLEKLLDVSDINSSIYEIYTKLVEASPELQSEFFTNFSKNNLKFISLTYRVISEEGQSDKTFYKVFDSNRMSLKNVITQDWYNNFKDKVVYYNTEGQEKYNPDAVKTINENFGTLLTNLKSSKTVTDSMIKDIITTLDSIGITTNNKVFQSFKQDQTVSGVKLSGYNRFSNLVHGEKKNSLENIVKSISRGINPFEDEQSSINTFVQEVINHNKDITEDSFKNVENKRVYSFANNNFLSKWVSNVKGDNYKNFLSPYLSPAFNRGSIWLNKLLNNESLRNEFDVVILDGLRNQEKGIDGIKFSDMNSKESTLTKLNLYLNGGNKYAYYAMPTAADNPLQRFIKFDRVDNAKLADTITNTIVLAEFKRIKEAKAFIQAVIEGKLSESALVKNYHYIGSNKFAMDGNAFNLQYITTSKLNEFKTLDELSSNEIGQIKDEVKKWLKSKENTLTKDLLAKDILVKEKDFQGKENIYNKQLDIKGLLKYENFKEALYSYIGNSFIANVEMTRLGLGDLAYYKKNSNDNLTTIDASKRTPELTAPGEDLNTSTYKTYNMAVLKTNKVNTPLYKGVDQTDAQGYCSLDRYLDILRNSGRWNSKLEKAVEDLKNGKDNDIILNPLKPFYFGHRFENGMVIPTQVKYSMIPLIPSLVNSRPDLAKLAKAMEDQDIQEVVFDSAVKVGLTVVNDFETELDNLHKYNMSNDSWRWQQNVPEHNIDSENLYGSQIRRLAISNINNETKYLVNQEFINGKDLKDLYQKIISDNVNEDLASTLNRFNNPKALQRMLLDEVAKNNLGEQYEKALQLNTNGDLTIPPTMTKKFEQILMSVFKNNVMKQKIKGITAVQVSKFGFEDLAFVKDENGNVTEAECLLPWYSKKYFPINDKGELDITGADPEILKMVGYRIPTEGKYSMIPLKVKGFLPDTSGSMIVLPTEVVAQMGSDFDVDKLYIMAPEFNKGNGQKIGYDLKDLKTTQQRNNALLDITKGILLNSKHFAEMTKPGGFETLKKLANKVNSAEGISGETKNYCDPLTQEYLREINQAGSQLIGLAANNNTNHPLAIDSHFHLNKGVVLFNGESSDTFDKERDENDNLISENLAEFLAAFVDNAKDPIASYLNINMYTYPVAALIVRTGYSLETMGYFLSQPILKGFTKAYNNTGNPKEAEKEVRAAYANAIKNKSNTPTKGISSFTTKELEDMLDKESDIRKDKDNFIRRQLEVLNTFVEYKDLSNGLSQAVSATRADALGLNPTLTGNRLFLDKVSASTSPNALVNTENVFKEDSTYPIVRAFTNAIFNANEEVGKYIPWNTPAINNARNEIMLNTSTKTDEESFIEDINYQGMTYLMSGFDWLARNEHLKRELLFGEDSVSNQLKTVKNKYPNLVDDYLLRSLKSDSVKEGEFKSITFINPLDKTGFERDLIIESWKQLLSDDREDVKKLGEDLIKYSFFTTGLTKDFNSFFDYIPIDYLKNIGYISHYEREKANLSISNYLDNFVVQYLQNNSSISDRIPEIKDNDIITKRNKKFFITTNTEKFVVDKDNNTWVKVIKYNDDLYSVQQSNEDGAVYSIIPKLGNGSTIMEYKLGYQLDHSIIESNNVKSPSDSELPRLERYTTEKLENSEKSDTFVESKISDKDVEDRIKECE